MRWYGWIAVLISWTIAVALLIATTMQLLPPPAQDSHHLNVSTAARVP